MDLNKASTDQPRCLLPQPRSRPGRHLGSVYQFHKQCIRVQFRPRNEAEMVRQRDTVLLDLLRAKAAVQELP